MPRFGGNFLLCAAGAVKCGTCIMATSVVKQHESLGTSPRSRQGWTGSQRGGTLQSQVRNSGNNWHTDCAGPLAPMWHTCVRWISAVTTITTTATHGCILFKALTPHPAERVSRRQAWQIINKWVNWHEGSACFLNSRLIRFAWVNIHLTPLGCLLIWWSPDRPVSIFTRKLNGIF